MLFPYHGALDQDLYTPEDLVKTFHDAGAVAIEVMRGWNDKSPEKWQRLLNAMKDNDMACSCFDIGINLVQPDSAERAKILDDCRRQIIAIAAEDKSIEQVYRLNLQLFPLTKSVKESKNEKA